jgi:adenylate kinase
MSIENLNIITLYGKPCSGKDNLAEKLLLIFDKSIKISTGEILRGAQEQKGVYAKYYDDLKEDFENVNNAGYIKDENVIKVVKKVMEECISEGKRSFIFSGFPRTINQYDIFNTMLIDLNQRFSIKENYFELEISDDIAKERASKRIESDLRKNVSPRKEDLDGKFDKRLLEFEEKTLPMIRYIESINRLIKIDASKSKDQVFSEVLIHLEGVHPGKERR